MDRQTRHIFLCNKNDFTCASGVCTDICSHNLKKNNGTPLIFFRPKNYFRNLCSVYFDIFRNKLLPDIVDYKERTMLCIVIFSVAE